MKRVWLILLLFIFGCSSGTVTRNKYSNKSYKIDKQDDVLILPTVVIKEIKTGSKSIEAMFNTLVFTILKEKGYDVKAAEETFSFLKEKKIEMNELKKTHFKDINKKIIDGLREKYSIKYFIKLNVMSHIKEELLNENKIFISLKVYTSEGSEVLFLNTHYQGENNISSSGIFDLVEDLIKDIENFTSK